MVTRAGVTQRAFDTEFASAEECFIAAFDHGLTLVAKTLSAATAGEQSWLARVRNAVRALLTFLDSHPEWARLLVIEPPAAGANALARRQRALDSVTRLLHVESSVNEAALSRELVAELVTGGAFSVVHSRIVKGDSEPLVELVPSLMSMIVLPYLGPEAARAELTTLSGPLVPPPTPVAGERRKTRTTYRTVLVLRAIGASPHSSNRDVAAAAGLTDEGQASKLLRRLHRQGLIENVGLGQAHGEPNAWLLTPAGERLAALTRSEPAGSSARHHGASPQSARQTCQRSSA